MRLSSALFTDSEHPLLFNNACAAQHEVPLEQHEVDALSNEPEFRGCVFGSFVDGE